MVLLLMLSVVVTLTMITRFPHQVGSLVDRKRGVQNRRGAWERESIAGLGTTTESISVGTGGEMQH